MGMPTPEPIYYTADMVRALNADVPDEAPYPYYETVYGELLVTRSAPRPWHEVIVLRLIVALTTYVEREGVAGHVFGLYSETTWGRDDVNVRPDALVVPLDEARSLDWRAMRTVLLAVEVLSPSTTGRDRFTKRRLYQERGTPCS